MTYKELLEEIDKIDAEDIPSDGSETEGSENENDETVNFTIVDSDTDSDPEMNIPLSFIKKNIQSSNHRDWSKNVTRQFPGHFFEDSGITDHVKHLPSPTPGKLFQLFFTDELLEYIVFQINLYSCQSNPNTLKTTNLQEIKTFFRNQFAYGHKKTSQLSRLLE